MKIGNLYIVLVGTVCLVACSSTKPPLPEVVKAPTPAFIPIEDEANVRIPERVKAYPFERYVDPSNPQVMHERQVVYRIEQPATWRLQTSSERQILIGATMSDGSLEKQPALLPNQIGGALASTRNSLDDQKRTTDDLNQKMADAQQKIEDNQQRITETQKQTVEVLHRMNDQLNSIKSKQDDQDAAIKKAQDMAAHPMIPATTPPPTPPPNKGNETPIDTNGLNL